MAINGISSGSNPYVQSAQLQSGMANAFKQRKQDFTALASALSSGDLQGAQRAFASLQQDIQGIREARGGDGADQGGAGNSSETGQSGVQGTSDPLKQDFTALANALSSGDLQGAQQAFALLQQDMQVNRHSHHHHHDAGSTQASSTDVGATSQADSASSTSISINVTA